MELAKRIAQRRKELGLSRDDLSVAVGVSVTAVQMWESGATKNLKLDHLCAIADALNVNVRWLAEGRGDKAAAESMDAYSTALSRRDEAANDQQRKGWERIAAVFAKAATVLILAIPPMAADRAEAAFNISKNIVCIARYLSLRLVRWLTLSAGIMRNATA